jgi:acetoin:2,6-dichlorophenolindophenol oxidoreductase subunit alpha
MISKSKGLSLLEQMVTIRCTEEHLLELFSKGHLNGTVHTCIGQEACAVGLISALDLEKDIVFSNHRGHGHYIGYSDDVRGLIAEIMGRSDGVCRGIGGSQHVQTKNFYTNGIQGASAPISVGMAFAEKISQTGAVTVVNLGDGTFGEGAVYEAMNIAALWNIPIVFSVEDNRYAQTTPRHLQHAGDLSDRGKAFGIQVHKVDGMRLTNVMQTAKIAVDAARSEHRPQILYMETYRFASHSKGDDFRDLKEIEYYKNQDPIKQFSDEIGLNENLQQVIDQARHRIKAIVDELIKDAL